MKSKLVNVASIVLVVLIIVIFYKMFTKDGISTNTLDNKDHIELTNEYIENLNEINSLLLTVNNKNANEISIKLEKLVSEQHKIFNHLNKMDIANEENSLLESKTKIKLMEADSIFFISINQLKENLSNSNEFILQVFN